MPESATQELSPAETSCPVCGSRVERDQLVCLECGARIALDYRRLPSWKLPVAIIGAVLLLAAGAFGFVLRDVTRDAQSDAANTPARAKTPAATKRRERQQTRKPAAKPRAVERPAPTRRREPRGTAKAGGGIQSWPREDGFTVVLLSAGDPAGAQQVAKSAIDGGVKAGILRSNDFSSLQSGFWLVFSGRYRTRGQAEKAVAKLARRFKGAYVQFVNGAEKRG